MPARQLEIIVVEAAGSERCADPSTASEQLVAQLNDEGHRLTRVSCDDLRQAGDARLEPAEVVVLLPSAVGESTRCGIDAEALNRRGCPLVFAFEAEQLVEHDFSTHELPPDLIIRLPVGAAQLRSVIELARLRARRRAEEAAQLRAEKKRYQDLLAATPEMHFRLGRDGTYLDWSPSTEFEPFVQPEDFLGRKVSEVLPAPLSEELTGLIEEVVLSGSVRDCEYDLGESEAQRRYSGRLVPGGDADVIAVVNDITERSRREQALRDSEARLRRLLEEAPDAFFVLSPDARVLWANACAAESLGRSVDEIVGRPYAAFCSSAEAPLTEQMISEVRSSLRRTHVRPDGSTTPVELHLSRVACPGISGSVMYFAVARNISARRRMEARLLQASRMASVGVLAAGVAHEINNPLTYVLGNLDTLQMDLRDLASGARSVDAELLQEMLAALDEAVEGASRVRKVVRDLGTFTRTQRRGQPSCELKTVLDAALRMLRNDIRHRAQLVCDYAEGVEVSMPAPHLSQVMMNVLSNAMHAIEPGRAARNEIGVRVTTVDAIVSIEISDTGHGIAEEHLERIFDPFFTTRSVGTGSGLGLSVCHNLVSEHGGHIDVESRHGEGTRVNISLPLASSEGREPPIIVPSVGPPSEEVPIRARILVVDDEPAILKVIARGMSGQHDVVAVSSGAEACALLRADASFDVILCDLMMPEMDGRELHAWVAQHHPALTDRIVFMTGGAFSAGARRFIESVENHRVTKPFEVKHLLGELETWLRTRSA